jgi:hypothetical protein
MVMSPKRDANDKLFVRVLIKLRSDRSGCDAQTQL